MRPVRIPETLVREIQRHARESYPQECCGFLVAVADPTAIDGVRSIVATGRATNEYDGERHVRFVIRSEELRTAERALEGTDRMIAGFYHSHPGHPARPSEFDRANAWPWYTYVVTSVTSRGTAMAAAFELDPDTDRFREVPLVVPPAEVSRVTASLSASEAR